MRIGRKWKRNRLLSLLEFLFIEGNAKWPYIRVVQTRNPTENELDRTHSKILETLWPYKLMVENVGFEIRETRFCIPVSLSNDFTTLCSLPGLHKTPIPNTFSGIKYTKQWPFGVTHYYSKFFCIIIICQVFKKLPSSWNKRKNKMQGL